MSVIAEILMNGTVTAERAGQINPNEAAAMRKEIQEAAALDEFVEAEYARRTAEILQDVENYA